MRVGGASDEWGRRNRRTFGEAARAVAVLKLVLALAQEQPEKGRRARRNLAVEAGLFEVGGIFAQTQANLGARERAAAR